MFTGAGGAYEYGYEGYAGAAAGQGTGIVDHNIMIISIFCTGQAASYDYAPADGIPHYRKDLKDLKKKISQLNPRDKELVLKEDLAKKAFGHYVTAIILEVQKMNSDFGSFGYNILK